MADYYRIFREFCEENKLFQEDDHVIVGLSGGADSMCLLLLMKRLSEELHLSLTAVHVNHELRGSEADEDENFVKDFCKEQSVPCVAVHADVKKYAEEHGLSLEEAGRIARYQTFGQLARKLSGSKDIPPSYKAAVAHHLDDNAETILMNLIRGTGLKGLQGMQPIAQRFGLTIVRPLLCMGRADTEGYLKEEKVQYRIDSSNLEDEYARNKLRLNIIPELNRINPRASEHINEAAATIIRAQDFIEHEAAHMYQLLIDPREDGLYVDLSRFGELDKVVREQIIRMMIEQLSGTLKDISRVHIRSILQLADKQTGRQVDLPYDLVALRSYSNLILRKEERAAEEPKEEDAFSGDELAQNEFMIDPSALGFEQSVFQLWKGMSVGLQLVHVNQITRQYLVAENEYTKAFDCAKIKGNLVFRPADPHDEIQFFGGRKTLRKYFTDEKIPRELRSSIPVLADDEQVLWIIGHRMSEGYKITELSNIAVQISLIPQS